MTTLTWVCTSPTGSAWSLRDGVATIATVYIDPADVDDPGTCRYRIGAGCPKSACSLREAAIAVHRELGTANRVSDTLKISTDNTTQFVIEHCRVCGELPGVTTWWGRDCRVKGYTVRCNCELGRLVTSEYLSDAVELWNRGERERVEATPVAAKSSLADAIVPELDALRAHVAELRGSLNRCDDERAKAEAHVAELRAALGGVLPMAEQNANELRANASRCDYDAATYALVAGRIDRARAALERKP